jgi:hypothetical protein
MALGVNPVILYGHPVILWPENPNLKTRLPPPICLKGQLRISEKKFGKKIYRLVKGKG